MPNNLCVHDEPEVHGFSAVLLLGHPKGSKHVHEETSHNLTLDSTGSSPTPKQSVTILQLQCNLLNGGLLSHFMPQHSCQRAAPSDLEATSYPT